jgi:hypothetical protein
MFWLTQLFFLCSFNLLLLRKTFRCSFDIVKKITFVWFDIFCNFFKNSNMTKTYINLKTSKCHTSQANMQILVLVSSPSRVLLWFHHRTAFLAFQSVPIYKFEFFYSLVFVSSQNFVNSLYISTSSFHFGKSRYSPTSVPPPPTARTRLESCVPTTGPDLRPSFESDPS